MKRLGFLSCLLLLPLFSSALASDYAHEAVLRAVKAGEIKPLNEIIEAVRPQMQGEIVKVEAERKNGAWVYEFRVVAPDGQRSDVYVDGKTARIIRVKRK